MKSELPTLTLLLLFYQQCVNAFIQTALVEHVSVSYGTAASPITRTHDANKRTLLFADESGCDDIDTGDFESQRMNIVRILQKSYYRNMDDDEVIGGNFGTQKRIKFDEETGRMLNLPIWNVGWVETPGRRNCLNVHEGRYTHMFETILSQAAEENKPLYFGHLYVPGGSGNTRYEEFQIRSWKDELADESRFDSSILDTFNGSDYVNGRAAVIGCLMQIVDYRRMDDGRLMVLVQSVERFVVDEVVETIPYAVANVQILLDEENQYWTKNAYSVNEETVKHLRGKVVSSSFYYHDYEFDKPKLPISDNPQVEAGSENYLSKDDVPWIGISKLLPFAHYSSDDVSLTVANEKRADAEQACLNLSEDAGGFLPLEQRLQDGGLLWRPTPVMSNSNIIRRPQDLSNCDTLETLLWLALDDFCKFARFKMPEEVACLRPPEMDYLDITPETTLSDQYPKLRRQRRLSYLAPALIENLDAGKDMRQIWLNTPSTKARLAGVLERFDQLNTELMGEFT